MVKTNPKVDTENEKSYLTIEEFNAIRKMDLPKDFLDFLEIGFRTGLTNRMESTKIEFLFVNELNHPYSILYFQEYFYKAFEQLYPDKKVRKHMCSIRAGNRQLLGH